MEHLIFNVRLFNVVPTIIWHWLVVLICILYCQRYGFSKGEVKIGIVPIVYSFTSFEQNLCPLTIIVDIFVWTICSIYRSQDPGTHFIPMVDGVGYKVIPWLLLFVVI